MDLRDKKLIELLDKNCRKSLKSISKETRISKQAAQSRIRKLEKEGIINSYYTVVDFFKLGYENINLYLKLEGLNDTELNELVDKFRKISSITWIAKLFGKYDLALSIFYRKTVEITEILFNINKLISPYLQESNMYFMNSVSSLPIGLTEKVENRKSFDIISTSESASIDSVDRKLLLIIESNSRINYTELARPLNLTANAVKYRIKKLEDKKVILGYRTLLDYNKLGLTWNLCILRTKPGTNLAGLISKLKDCQEVIFINKTIDGTLIVDILSKGFLDLKNTMNQIKQEFDIISRYEVLNIIEVNKLVPSKS